jgi:peptidoglycan/xylan/chitin deacetylase (PgdA/CDA1 family)
VTDGFRVALTIDAEHPDRPTEPGVTASLLDTLGAAGVRATFFVQGRWAEAEPELAARIAAEGHLVGNHTHHHARMTMLSRAGLARDVRAAEKAIAAATGADPRPWFRCPFGSGGNDPRIVDGLARLGYVDVGWDVDGLDWDGRSAARLEASVVRATLGRGDGAVVLVHGWPRPTAAALPAIIRRLAEVGAAFIGVDELDVVPGRRSGAVATPA